jgi:hypothetical protein
MLLSLLVCRLYYLTHICCFTCAMLIKYKGDVADFSNFNSLAVGYGF